MEDGCPHLLHLHMTEACFQKLVLVEHLGIGTVCRLYHCVQEAQAGGLYVAQYAEKEGK